MTISNEKNRRNLQARLEGISGLKGVYFQPPESVKLKYDCVVYEFAKENVSYADDVRYLHHARYDLTLISKDPECAIVDALLNTFSYISLDRCFSADNLYHWVFSLFF